MNEYTPGPWKTKLYASGVWGIRQAPEAPSVALDGKTLPCGFAICLVTEQGSGIDDANARLIVALPDLLEACIRAHDALLSLHVCNQDNSFANEIRTLLKAAIAKATD